MSASHFRRAHSLSPERSKARISARPISASANVSSPRSAIPTMLGHGETDTEQQSMLVEAEPEIFRPVRAAGASRAIPMCAGKGRCDDAEERARHGVEERRAEIAAKSASKRRADFAPHQFARHIAHYLSVHPQPPPLELPQTSCSTPARQATRRRIGCEGSTQFVLLGLPVDAGQHGARRRQGPVRPRAAMISAPGSRA